MAKVVLELLEAESCAKCYGLKERVKEVIQQLDRKDIEIKYLDLSF
jgi:hypothetical protein